MEMTLDDVMLDWIADPDRINYGAVRALSLPITQDTLPFSLYHALLNGFFLPYRTGYMNKVAVTAESLVKDMARDVSDGVAEYYPLLHNGQLEAMSTYIEKYSVQGLKNELASPAVGCTSIKPECVVLEYLSRITKIGILVLNESKHDVFALGYEGSVRDFASFVVLLFHRATEGKDAHFTLVMLQPAASESDEVDIEELESTTQTLFTPNHPFIKALLSRVDTLSNSMRQRKTMR